MKTQKPNQKFWQVFFPFIVTAMIVIFAGYYLFSNIRSENLNLRIWSDISTIFILLPIFFLVLIDISLVIILIGLVHKSRKAFDQNIGKIKTAAIKSNNILTKITGFLAHPWIALESLSAIFTRKEE